MRIPAAKWILVSSLFALPAFAAQDDDRDDDDTGYQPDLNDAKDVVEHFTGGEHPANPHVVEAAPEAERFAAHGGMSWEELKAVHDQARASGAAVHFNGPIGKAPNPFEVDPALRFHAREGQLAREGLLAGESGAQLARGVRPFESAAPFARGSQAFEAGAFRTGSGAVTVVEDVGLARGTFTAARAAEEGLLLKIGAGALGLGGLAASRRRRND